MSRLFTHLILIHIPMQALCSLNYRGRRNVNGSEVHFLWLPKALKCIVQELPPKGESGLTASGIIHLFSPLSLSLSGFKNEKYPLFTSFYLFLPLKDLTRAFRELRIHLLNIHLFSPLWRLRSDFPFWRGLQYRQTYMYRSGSD